MSFSLITSIFVPSRKIVCGFVSTFKINYILIWLNNDFLANLKILDRLFFNASTCYLNSLKIFRNSLIFFKSLLFQKQLERFLRFKGILNGNKSFKCSCDYSIVLAMTGCHSFSCNIILRNDLVISYILEYFQLFQ